MRRPGRIQVNHYTAQPFGVFPKKLLGNTTQTRTLKEWDANRAPPLSFPLIRLDDPGPLILLSGVEKDRAYALIRLFMDNAIRFCQHLGFRHPV